MSRPTVWKTCAVCLVKMPATEFGYVMTNQCKTCVKTVRMQERFTRIEANREQRRLKSAAEYAARREKKRAEHAATIMAATESFGQPGQAQRRFDTSYSQKFHPRKLDESALQMIAATLKQVEAYEGVRKFIEAGAVGPRCGCCTGTNMGQPMKQAHDRHWCGMCFDNVMKTGTCPHAHGRVLVPEIAALAVKTA